jgi:ATP-dependent DNA helicase RecG
VPCAVWLPAGLPLPEFLSDRAANEFKLTLFLHNLLTQDDHAWLRGYAGNTVSADEAKVLIYARATGAVDNTACRDFCGSDTLGASLILRRLRDRSLLVKQGAGKRTYYTLNLSDSPAGIPTSSTEDAGILSNPHKLNAQSPQDLVGIPAALLERIRAAGQKPRQAVMHELLRELCALRPCTAQKLCQILGRSDPRELARTHLKPMREAGILALLYPESPKHPHQAYMTVAVR